MKPHPRIRKSVKWGGAVVCVMLVAVWLSTRLWIAAGFWRNGNWIEFSAGLVSVGTDSSLSNERPSPGWHIDWLPGKFRWWFSWGQTGPLRVISTPLWVLAVGMLIPTTVAWKWDAQARRRARLNHCPTCNYDRRGLPAASPCPECGAVPAPSAQTLT